MCHSCVVDGGGRLSCPTLLFPIIKDGEHIYYSQSTSARPKCCVVHLHFSIMKHTCQVKWKYWGSFFNLFLFIYLFIYLFIFFFFIYLFIYLFFFVCTCMHCIWQVLYVEILGLQQVSSRGSHCITSLIVLQGKGSNTLKSPLKCTATLIINIVYAFWTQRLLTKSINLSRKHFCGFLMFINVSCDSLTSSALIPNKSLYFILWDDQISHHLATSTIQYFC